MTLSIPAKVLIHVLSYDCYDITLSTGKQRRHMIKGFILYLAVKTNVYQTWIKVIFSLQN